MVATRALRVASPPSLESETIFSDTFSRYVDGALSGRTPEVGAYSWVTTGAGVAGESIVSGEWSSNVAGNSYALMRLSETPWEYGGVFESKDGTTWLALVACVLDFTTYGISAMWHPLVNASVPAACVWSPQYFDTASRPGGTTVSGGGADFSKSLGAFALAANTKYRYRIFLNAPYADHVIETMDGTVVATMRAYHALMASLIGPWMFLEVAGNRNFVWHSAYARSRPASDSSQRRRVRGGMEATPIGMNTPAGGNFTTAHVGPGAPKGVFSARYSGTLSDAPGVYSSAGSAEFVIKPEVSGNTGRLLVYNGAGGVSKVEMDGAYALNLIGHSGSAFLTKPANAAAPYFAGQFGIGGASGPTFNTGSASPEAAVTAPVGSIYMRTGGGAATSFYVKETGAGNTGWVAK